MHLEAVLLCLMTGNPLIPPGAKNQGPHGFRLSTQHGIRLGERRHPQWRPIGISPSPRSEDTRHRPEKGHLINGRVCGGTILHPTSWQRSSRISSKM